MKRPISIALCCLVLAACNDMITRWWNYGPELSEKEKKRRKNALKNFVIYRSRPNREATINCIRNGLPRFIYQRVSNA